jgi:hypothetical protein
MLNELLIKELSEQVGINTFDIQVIKDGEIYSTNEVKTNKKWIDGKPIYRKGIFLNALPNNDNTTSYNHNISDVDIIYFDKCFAIWNYGQSNQFTNPLPLFNYTGNNIYLFDADRTGFKIKIAMDRTAIKGFITLEYTKTTD